MNAVESLATFRRQLDSAARRVVRIDPRRWQHSIPAFRISRATRLREQRTPSSSSSAWIRRDP